jgi:hypothetical protein
MHQLKAFRGRPGTAISGMFRLGRRDWIIVTAFIVAGASGYVVYNKWLKRDYVGPKPT